MSDLIINVMLADDHAVVRMGFRLLLEGAPDIRVVAEAESGEDAVRRYQEVRPDVLVLDLSMPDIDGLAVQQRLLETGATLAVVFLTGRGDIPSSVRAMKAGAVDFLTKPVKAADLAAAVRTAMAQAEVRHVEAEQVAALRARHMQLTPREAEVMRHVIAGKLNKVIAADLGTTEQTIKVHRARVMEKLAVGSVAELVNAARMMGIEAIP